MSYLRYHSAATAALILFPLSLIAISSICKSFTPSACSSDTGDFPQYWQCRNPSSLCSWHAGQSTHARIAETLIVSHHFTLGPVPLVPLVGAPLPTFVITCPPHQKLLHHCTNDQEYFSTILRCNVERVRAKQTAASLTCNKDWILLWVYTEKQSGTQDSEALLSTARAAQRHALETTTMDGVMTTSPCRRNTPGTLSPPLPTKLRAFVCLCATVSPAPCIPRSFQSRGTLNNMTPVGDDGMVKRKIDHRGYPCPFQTSEGMHTKNAPAGAARGRSKTL